MLRDAFPPGGGELIAFLLIRFQGRQQFSGALSSWPEETIVLPRLPRRVRAAVGQTHGEGNHSVSSSPCLQTRQPVDILFLKRVSLEIAGSDLVVEL